MGAITYYEETIEQVEGNKQPNKLEIFSYDHSIHIRITDEHNLYKVFRLTEEQAKEFHNGFQDACKYLRIHGI